MPRSNHKETSLAGKWEPIFDSLTDFLSIHDTDFRVIKVNRAFADHLGMKPEEIEGRFCYEIVHGTDKPPPECPHLQSANHKEENTFKISEPRLGDEVRITVSPIIDNNGELKGSFHLIRNISVEKKIRQQLSYSETYLRSIIDNEPECVKIIDQNGRLLEMNPAGLRMIEAESLQQVAGQQVYGLVAPEHREAFQELTESVCRGTSGTLEFEMIGLKGMRLWLETHAVPFLDERDGETYLLAVTRNVTERKQAEKNLIPIMKAVESASDAIGISDSQGHHFYQNKAFSDLFGYSTAEELETAGGGPAVVKDPAVAKEMFDAIMQGNSWADELEMVTKNEQVFPAFERADAIKDQDGKLIGLIGIITDITERKKNEEVLQKSQEQLNLAVQATNLGPWDWDLRTNEVFFSPEWRKQIGYEEHELSGKYEEWESRLHPEDREQVLDAVQSYIDGRKPEYDVEFRLRHKDGTYRWIYTRGLMLRDGNGKPQRMLGCHVDITERKQADEKLRLSETRLRESQEVARIGSWSWNLVDNTLEWSDETCRRFDKDPETFTPTVDYFVEHIHPDDRDAVQKTIEESLAHDTPYHIQPRIRNENGRDWILEGFGRVERDPGGRPMRFAGTAQDITERMQAMQAFERSSREWSAAMDASDDAIYLLDVNRHILRANKAFFQITGSNPESALGKHIEKIVHPQGELTPCPVCLAQEEMRDEVIIMEHDHPDNPAGRPIEITVKVVRDETGQPISIFMKLHDLTEQRNNESVLRRSKEEWERSFNAITDIITVQNLDMTIIRANKAACDFFELTPDKIIGKKCYEIFRETSTPCEGCPELETILAKQSHSAIIEHKQLGKIFHVSAAPVFGEDNELENIVHVAKDITERKRLEEELFQAHKMEAIGTLAGGIAHDFNNILAAIFGYTELAMLEIEDTGKAVDRLKQVTYAASRARNLVKQILTFSRKGKPQKEPLIAHLIIKESIKLLKASLPASISIREEIDGDSGLILADPTQVQQILVNLCTNSLHAMEQEKGILTVRLSRRELGPEEMAGGVSPGPFIELTISDTGQGIDRIHLKRIFEPYFTTKGAGKGTGLGLAMVHGIIQEYGGMIKVDSELGKGTTFRVYIPALEEMEAEVGEEKEEPLPTGTERILLVDDEDAILEIMGANLEKLGYRVATKTGSLEALKEFQANPWGYDLIITDQTMPGMSGFEMAIEMLAARPDMPVILCTGHSNIISREMAKEIGIKEFVFKPINSKELAGTVRKVLDENA